MKKSNHQEHQPVWQRDLFLQSPPNCSNQILFECWGKTWREKKRTKKDDGRFNRVGKCVKTAHDTHRGDQKERVSISARQDGMVTVNRAVVHSPHLCVFSTVFDLQSCSGHAAGGPPATGSAADIFLTARQAVQIFFSNFLSKKAC